MSDSFQVIAIISAFNEGDIISSVIQHLAENGVGVYLIDNRSTDDTVQQARQWLGQGLLDIESFPKKVLETNEQPEPFNWTAILQRKEELSRSLPADWFIHHDADEIRESPWPGLTLKEAIHWVDTLGYNCIDFRVFNFPPIDDGFAADKDPHSYFRFYEDAAECDRVQLKCWKAGTQPVSLAPFGGHEAWFEGRKTFPIQFILRHYPIRSQAHGLRKVFGERRNRLLLAETSKGWHKQYDQVADQAHSFVKNPEDLQLFDIDRARFELILPEEITRRMNILQADRLEWMKHAGNLESGQRALSDHAKNLEAERDALIKHAPNFEMELERLRNHAAILEKERDALTNHARNVEGERDQLLAHARNMETERGELREGLMVLQGEYDQLKRTAESAESDRTRLTRDVRKLEQDRADLLFHSHVATRELDASRRRAETVEAELDSLKIHYRNLEQDRTGYKQHVENVESQRDGYRQHALNVEHDRDRIRAQGESQRALLEQRNAALQHELQSLRNSRSWRWTAFLRRAEPPEAIPKDESATSAVAHQQLNTSADELREALPLQSSNSTVSDLPNDLVVVAVSDAAPEVTDETSVVSQVADGATNQSGFAVITTSVNPKDAKLLGEVRLFAVLGTWMEADIVAATVRNAMTQGCERVYLVDNSSTDGTVEAACAEGAILARTFQTERYDEGLRLRHMNGVVADISQAEPDEHIWWLFLDADEFPHGPWGMTLHEYLKTLDERFRIVGSRFFDHYPSGDPQFVPGRHPLDFQPLCEELAYPMCLARHRKHPLQRFDKAGPAIECGKGFHLVHCSEQLYEPAQPAFLHHFPYRQEQVTRSRLDALWAKDRKGNTRAEASHDTHMLTRFRSLSAVYAQDWAAVENFLAVDPMSGSLDSPTPAAGVHLKPWAEQVDVEHQQVLRWYSPLNAWNYEQRDKFHYGDDVTYRKGMAFLDGHGVIEDWGCGFAHARGFVHDSTYVGVDGSSQHADKIADLREYTSDTDCLFMRHVLEHNFDWKRVLVNAVASFRYRMVLIIFTPLAEATRVIATSTTTTSIPVPDIAFRKEDLTDAFKQYRYAEESLATDTQYNVEHIFYIEKSPPSPRATAKDDEHPLGSELRTELDAWRQAGMAARFWWRDDDATADSPRIRRLLELGRDVEIVPALAVIPQQADRSLSDLRSTYDFCIWQHGWSHQFHENGEFGDGRALNLLIDDARAGQRSLDGLFGPSGWQRVFVPPNHRLTMPFKAIIPQLGYAGLSAGTELTPPMTGVVEVNAEVDVMDWPRQSMHSLRTIGGMLARQLATRRLTQSTEPVGILTHHPQFDDEAWDLMSVLLRYLQSHPATEFVSAATLFAPQPQATSAGGTLSRSSETWNPGARSLPTVTVVITSCGRQDLLAQTVDSFLKYNTYPIHQFIVIEDGKPELNIELEQRYQQWNIEWLATGTRSGQIAAIDLAYSMVEGRYIFHCEDDWEFYAPGFIEKSLAVLEQNPEILQVWIRALNDTNNSPLVEPVFFAGRTPYRLIKTGYHTPEWGTWHGFSFNPGLRRRHEYRALGSFATLDPLGEKKAYEVEREASAFYLKQGLLAAILADEGGQGYVRHIGWSRHVPELALEQ